MSSHEPMIRYHEHVSLARLNLNQLVALQALLNAQGVGPAARDMGVTQSAMSHTLRQLRALLDDPLLVRIGNQMKPTPFAEEVLPRLSHALGELEAIVTGRAAFDPGTITDTFTLSTHDGVVGHLGGRLLARLRERAPQARLRVVPIATETLERDLGRGRIDAAFMPPLVPLDALCTQPIENSGVKFVVACRRGHPRVKKRVSLDTYCALPHVMVTVTGEGASFIDHMLQEQGRERDVVARVPYAFGLGDILTQSDLLATLPSIDAQLLSERWPLNIVKAPFEIPASEMMLVWHPRFDAEPASRFFREIIMEVTAELIAEHGVHGHH